MIPTMLLAGLCFGALVHDGRSLTRSLMLGAVVSVLWGILVGIYASSLIVAAGGTALAVINVALGALIGWGLRCGCGAVRANTEPSTTSR